MFTFIDENGFFVDLSFKKGQFKVSPKHVLVMVNNNDKWLCTIHKRRGVEFPGGKVEPGETLEDAAVREVYEETNVHITDIKWFADYLVHSIEPFCKAVYTGRVAAIDPFIGDHETMGMLWLTTEELLNYPNLSFYMRDAGLKKMLQEVKHHERQW